MTRPLKNTRPRSTDKLWTIPNAVSILRILLIIPIVAQLRENYPEANFTAFVLIAIAYLTDFLDGFLARALKSESRIGQILDPIGDKLLAVIVAAVLYFRGNAPLYFFILILARDFVISLGAFYAFNTGKMIMLPLLSGKVTTFVLGIVLACYPLRYSFVTIHEPWGAIIGSIVRYGTYLATGLLLFSGVFYAVNYYRSFLQRSGRGG